MNSRNGIPPRFSKVRSGFIFLMFMTFSMFLTLYGCGDSSTGPANGGNSGGNNNNGEEEIGSEPTFSNVRMIFQQNCGNCHIGGTTNGVRLDSYTNVMESVGNQYGIEVVQPGNADDSPLVDKIEPNPSFGDRMPQDGPFLSTERINQIKEWIDEGAENN